MQKDQDADEVQEFSFKSLFTPFTSVKAIHWIIVIGLIVYSNSLLNGFLGDDNGQIIDNEAVHSINNFFRFFISGTFNGGDMTGAGIYYKPVFSIILSTIYSFFGPVPFFFHFAQLTIHIVNSIMLFLLYSKVLRKTFSFFTALIFLIHPINTEAVVYISNMQETLFFFFGLIALLICTKNTLSLYTIIIVQFFLLLSLLSKESGILFLALTNIYILLFKRTYTKMVVFISIITFSFYCYLRFIMAKIYFNQSISSPIMEASLYERLLTIPAIFSYYIKTFFFPKILLFNQNWVIKEISVDDFIIPTVISLFFFLILFFVYKFLISDKQSKRYVLFLILWFLIGMLLHVQLFPLDATVSDRWFYFPGVGLIGIMGIFMQSFFIRNTFKHKQKVILISCSIIILILSSRTIMRNSNWSNGFTLYTHDLPLMKPNFAIENALAYEYYKKHDIDNSFIHAQRSVQIYPSFANLTNLGDAYFIKKDYQNAKESFEKAIKKNDKYYFAYADLALVLMKYDPNNEASTFIQSATKKFPTSKKLWLYSIIIEDRTGDKTSALQSAEQYYLLSQTQESLDLYLRLQKNLPFNIKLDQ